MTGPGKLAPAEGDIVVTPVAGHYAIGRIAADGRGTQALIQPQNDRDLILLIGSMIPLQLGNADAR